MYDIIVIGGGPAGLSAACSAFENGAKNILIIERDKELGGILNQCVHNGFGLHYFKEELTGPEYAERFVNMLKSTSVEVKLDTMVLNISENKIVSCVNSVDGFMQLEAKSIILAMGCRERTRGAISIPGDRPAGVFTAGSAQKYLNIDGYMVGKRVLILGSGDIGLIMARRMTLEGAKVLACVEVMPYSGGLNRNIVQCLNDFDIPLYLSHTIIDIQGKERVEKVIVAKVGEDRKPIKGTEMEFECDTILLSVGLIPENELTRGAGIDIDPRTNGAIVYENMETSIEGIFACGNVVHVHDLVDYVTQESARAGKSAAEYTLNGEVNGKILFLKNGNGVTYTVPQKIRLTEEKKNTDVFFRVNRIMHDSVINVTSNGEKIASFKREHMAPGEMEHIVLPSVLLKKATGEILVEIQSEVK